MRSLAVFVTYTDGKEHVNSSFRWYVSSVREALALTYEEYKKFSDLEVTGIYEEIEEEEE